jgi:hypothetical protein
MTNKPIDLVVANLMHEISREIVIAMAFVKDVTKRELQIDTMDKQLANQIARKLLCEISHEANISHVYAALKAVGAPHSVADIKEGLQAVKETSQ